MSCSDVQTIKAGNGSQLTFSFDFPYIFKSEIHVYFWNVTTKEWDEKLTTDSTYPWQITDANPTIVEFTSTAPPAPTAASVPNEATQDNVRIRRITKVDDIRALFNPGSAIRSDDLNKNFEQLRYAIQESGCQDVPEDLKEYLEEYYWDRYDNTLYDGDTWVSDDTKIASTEAIDDRIDSKINDAITTDIATDGTGITVTDDGDGTITLGLGSSSVDLDRIKDGDIITYAEQNAGSPSPADSNIFTASAAARRFDTLVQTGTPSGSDWETGKTWLQNDDELTLSIWNGNTWTGVASGGTFTNQPKVIYVDASAGDDNNDGHRISRPKLTIKAAINDINNDSTYGDGAIVVVAPGVYQEAAPIQIQKRDVSVIGDGMRNCVIHPTSGTETNTMFEVNSGTYLKNLTFTGMKASGTRGESGSLWEDSTYGLPGTQGWNVAFYANATIVKSPYIQNCTNFSDSEIDNDDLDFYAGSEDKGRAGDNDSAMTGGGLLIDGSVPAATSPLRSIVCDSYTHVGLDGPGIFVTNNGYAQCTSSYAFFNHFHIACHNGGQANLAASTTDFGRYSLIASGKSPNAIFTSTVDGAASDGDTTFNIDAPTAGTDLYGGNEAWFGSATRPQPNMLVEVNSVIYPILSATANGSGWTVEISRPDPNNRSTNLGLNGAISDASGVNFYLRSMIASSGHTMEYAGSGTDYRALPENGGVPNESREITELDNGNIWTAITNQNGKVLVGGNQTDDPIFEVDQQLGFVTIPEGSIAFNLLSDETPQLGGNLDVNGREIVTDSNNDNIVLNPHGTGSVNVSLARITNVADPSLDQDAATKNWTEDTFLPLAGGTLSGAIAMGTSKITGLGDPTANQDAATKNYVDTSSANTNYVAVSGDDMTGALAMGTNKITGLGDPTNDQDAATKSYTDSTFMTRSGGTFTGGVAVSGGNLTLNAQSDLRLADSDSSNWVAFQAPGTVSANVTWTLPATDATVNGHALKSDGSGNLSWGTAGGASGGGTDQVFYENDQSVTTDYTIGTNKNAMSAGPITIDSGATVTIPDDSTWVIV